MRTNFTELTKAADFEVVESKAYPLSYDAEAGRFGSGICGGYSDPRKVKAFGKIWEKDTTTGCIFEDIEA